MQNQKLILFVLIVFLSINVLPAQAVVKTVSTSVNLNTTTITNEAVTNEIGEDLKESSDLIENEVDSNTVNAVNTVVVPDPDISSGGEAGVVEGSDNLIKQSENATNNIVNKSTNTLKNVNTPEIKNGMEQVTQMQISNNGLSSALKVKLDNVVKFTNVNTANLNKNLKVVSVGVNIPSNKISSLKSQISNLKTEIKDNGTLQLVQQLENKLNYLKTIKTPVIDLNQINLQIKDFQEKEMERIQKIQNIAEKNDEIGVLEKKVQSYQKQIMEQAEELAKIKAQGINKEIENLEFTLKNLQLTIQSQEIEKVPYTLHKTVAVQTITENINKYTEKLNTVKKVNEDLKENLKEIKDPVKETVLKETILRNNNISQQIEKVKTLKAEIADEKEYMETLEAMLNEGTYSEEIHQSPYFAEIEKMSLKERKILYEEKNKELKEKLNIYLEEQKELQNELRQGIDSLNTVVLNK